MGIILEIGKKIVNFFVKDAAERRRFIAEFNYNASSGFQTLFVDTLYEAVSCEGNPAQDYRHEMSAPVWASGFAVIAKAGREVPIDEILTIGKIILSDQKLVRKMFVNELNMASSYIQGIQTGKILDDVTADKIGALISGVPTPWARAKLFKFALATLNTPDPNIGSSGLTQYYEMLHGEWRGLIALLALHSDRIRFSAPVVMNVKGEDYDIASAFGRMLFKHFYLFVLTS